MAVTSKSSANAKPTNNYSMAANLRFPSFATRLRLALLILVALTALSTGIPAYWLTRHQLEEQTWANIRNAQQATHSLLEAQSNQLADLALLLAERPTLPQLISSGSVPDLENYLQNFRTQIDLDILVICLPDAEPALANPACTQVRSSGAFLLNGRPALLVVQEIAPNTQPRIGQAIVGRWLDDSLLRQLAAGTGVTQNILLPDGTRLSSNPLFTGTTAVLPDSHPAESKLIIRNDPYFAIYMPVGNPPAFISEVALPVGNLETIEDQALLLLIISTSIVALLGVLLGSFYVHDLMAPLQKLTDVADQISSGDLMTPIPLFSGPVEISTLATALHQSQASMLEALAERSQARDWLNMLIQSIVEGVVTVAEDGRITFFSQGAETLTGWKAPEAIGLPVNQLFPLAENETQPFFSLLPPPGSKRQIAIHNREGQHIVLAVTGVQFTSSASDTSEIALVLRDVTQEAALRHLRSYFLANISHEFRTPLSTLQASLELLLDEQENLSSTEMRQLLKPSYLSLTSLQTLIGNLLESSDIEAGEFVIRSRPFSLQASLTDALHIVAPLLERRRQAIALHQPDQLPIIQADPARITQVLVNLLTNASKYSPQGAVVTIELGHTADHLRVAVSDQGPGIPPAERANLFRSFVRLDSVDQEQYGVGLGLYVVKQVVEAHNGRVGISDPPNGGSTFWFELPLSQSQIANRKSQIVNRKS